MAPAPVLHPGTLEPITPDFLSVLFPMPLIQQETSTERWVEIPGPVREVYRLWAPTSPTLAVAQAFHYKLAAPVADPISPASPIPLCGRT